MERVGGREPHIWVRSPGRTKQRRGPRILPEATAIRTGVEEGGSKGDIQGR